MSSTATIDAPKPKAAAAPAAQQPTPAQPLRRYTTAGLMDDQREIEIEHAGRIYRLRITQLNKLILTA
ncbi:hemin uptake protein HemP [Pseudoduganella sp. S-14]|jgi:hemin uptake protein HemP|uniref:hemin uptake protein HemP n=1 Tax=Pseudoduganella sp. S-14 TaxID=3404065 RepID=UPI003CF009C7